MTRSLLLYGFRTARILPTFNATGLWALDYFSYEAAVHDNNDGGPAKGGEFILAMSPQLIAGEGWQKHNEDFIQALSALDGIRLPGQRRHKNRLDTGPRHINAALLDKINSLL